MAPNERNNEMEIGPDYIRVQTIQPHWGRKKDILKAHPEVKSLYGPDSRTAFHVLAVIGITTWLAWMVSQASLLTVFVVAYTVGAMFANIQWVFVHELTHDLVFRSPTLNTLFLLLTNMSNIIPAAISFRYHHKTHHAHLNESYSDPDLPSEIEDSIFGHSMLGKATWLSSFAVVQSLRTLRSPQPFEWALPINYLLNGLYGYLVWTYIGPQAVMYLLLSSLLAVGFLLHPFGGRWLAEHWAVHRTPQETYSYYGSLNKVSYNIGHHQEHHDFTAISWTHLPKLRKIAPEFYETLHFHPSYVRLIWEYLTNCNFTLKSRVVRWPKYHIDEKQE